MREIRHWTIPGLVLSKSQIEFLILIDKDERLVSHSFKNRTAKSLYIKDFLFYCFDRWHLTDEGKDILAKYHESKKS